MGKTSPEIRFDGYHSEWNPETMGDVVDIGNGRDYKGLEDGDVPVYGTGGYMTSVNEALSYDQDAVGIGRKGTIDKPYILRAPFWTVDTLFYAIPKVCADLNFTFSLFQSIDWASKNEATGVPSLSKTTIAATNVLVPEIDEQRRIGSFFSNMNSLIDSESNTLQGLKDAKAYFLRVMFSSETRAQPVVRIGSFNDKWKDKPFSEIAERLSATARDKVIPHVEYEDIDAGEGRLNKDLHSKNCEKTGIKFTAGDVLYGKLRPYLKNWLLPDFDGVAVGDFWVLHPIDTDAAFLYYLIQTEQYSKVANQSAGSKMPRSDWKLVSAAEFAVPDNIEEQKAIGRFFQHLDMAILAQSKKVDALKQAKKYFLQKMFI